VPQATATVARPRKSHTGRGLIIAGVVVVVATVAGGAWSMSNSERIRREAALATGGDSRRAIPVMLANGCAGCHTISGVPGAQGLVGPSLDRSLATRSYIGGSLPNTTAHLIRWLRFSREVDPHTAMPSTLISEQDARDVAAYLYALH
jgi:mono/diheme cytochrome c family protein